MNKNLYRLGVLLGPLLTGVGAGCGSPPPASVTTAKTPKPPPPRASSSGGDQSSNAQAFAATPPEACPSGLGVEGSIDVTPGAPAYFYEDRPALVPTSAGAAYVYLDHESYKAFVARLSAEGATRSVRPIKFPTADERSHVVAASRGDAVAVAAAVYHAQKEADIELLLLDDQDRARFSVRVDPSPLFDGTPALAWGKDEIAVAWLRGPYPSHTSVEIAHVDPTSGKVRSKQSFASSGKPGVPAIAWDGEAYWVAYQADTMKPGIVVARVNAKGVIIAPRPVAKGSNPFILPTPQGIALAYDDADGGRGIWLTMLDPTGATSLPPTRVATHPDPIGAPRKPVLAWDGARLAVAYEVHFHASVFSAREPEADLIVVDTKGAASPPVRLHANGDAGEMPAVLWTGKHWLTVFNRNRLQEGKTPTVVAARLACLSGPPAPAPAATGPCEPQSRPAPEALLADARRATLDALPLSDGGWAAISIPTEDKQNPRFARGDRDGKTIASAEIRSTTPARSPALARLSNQFAVAWEADDAIVVTLLGENGETRAQTRLPRSPKSSGAPALATTPAGLVVAWSDGAAISTALLSGDGRILRPASKILTPPFQPGACALGHGPHGLLLAFTTGTEISETSVVRAARLSDRGDAPGAIALASGPHAFLRNPAILGTPAGFIITATGPFAREVIAIELGPKGEVVKPERKLLSSYGFVATGASEGSSGVRIFGFDGKTLTERPLCP
ncbi:MAG TPA: hypothetical protein VE093_06465 [Polyangiaceae bacterium]|nr:hypothetical protein [Polyangiaceae bacterium]